jgi:hypothetical protein
MNRSLFKILKEGDYHRISTSFFLQKDSIEFIQAIEDSTLWFICYDELQYIYKHFPEFNVMAGSYPSNPIYSANSD